MGNFLTRCGNSQRSLPRRQKTVYCLVWNSQNKETVTPVTKENNGKMKNYRRGGGGMFLKTLGLCSQFLSLRIVNFIVVLFYGPLTFENFSYFPSFRRKNLSHSARLFSNFRYYKFHYIGRGLKPTKGHHYHVSNTVVHCV